ncbi:protein kintoun [Frankliniella occidentalis]|uniref:Protein kintoun n=1 Tax=Frankliniella occidentalis TaxID=133901 RepID=A0A6J1S5D1_FRAOC|nr:protein kintoun [Frankliniella occidentalis]
MEARRKKFEDLNITRDEINNIGQALQKEEFRKLFAEYCEEVTNPENKKLYQNEVTELEKQRGVDVTFINPEPGFVVKTSIDGERKAFINICQNDVVSKPSSSVASEEGSQGRRWSLPFSLAPAREDYDKQKNHCTVFDVVFHPETLKLAEKNLEFRKMLINTAFDAVEDNCKAKLDRTNMKYPKMLYKGTPQAAVIRKKIPNHQTAKGDHEFLEQMPYPTDRNPWSKVEKGKNVPEKKIESAKYATPKYCIKYRHGVELSDYTTDATARLNATVPKELVICIDLPLLNSAKDLNLDVTAKSLSLVCQKPKYKLELVLPYGVDENAGNANFDVTTRKLTIEVPVKRSPLSLQDIGREDSGVESDPGGRADEDSDEKSPSYHSDNGSDTSDHQDLQNSSSLVDESTKVNGNAFSDPTESVDKDIDHLLPNFSLNTYENMVAVVLHVKNVDSGSLVQGFLQERQGIQLSFSSVGAGMFPQHYGFCLALPDAVGVESDSLSVEIWDNNVVAQFGLTSSNVTISEVYVGTGPHDLQLKDAGNLAVVEQKLADLQLSTDISASRSPIVIVHAAEENELVLNVQPFSSNVKDVEEISPENSTKAEESASGCAPTEDSSKGNEVRAEKGRVRHLSECSSDDLEGKKIRGILKKRPLRSLSESNADDYVHYQSSSFSDESGPNSAMGSVNCIAEEGSETGCETENEGGYRRQRKKSVRFNDVVAQQTFRPNSSILGQRKKNQRKQKNKKKAQERRASESENSEPDSEHDKARRRACHSEGEISDLEEKSKETNKFKKEEKIEPSTHQARKILRRTNSSESDEETKDESSNKTAKVASPAGDTVMKVETSQPQGTHVESSEDERDGKTEEKKKKKKKRKGKKVTEQGDGCKIASKEVTDFRSGLVLELEM